MSRIRPYSPSTTPLPVNTYRPQGRSILILVDTDAKLDSHGSSKTGSRSLLCFHMGSSNVTSLDSNAYQELPGLGHIPWPLAKGLPWEFVPPPPRSTRAYCSLLHGDSYQFFLYALHVAFQLRRLSCKEPTDLVLLMGPSRFFEETCFRNALHAAGWTHLVRVDCIDGSHLSSTRRHDQVFTKLCVFGLPYSKTILLDLDLHIRGDVSCLFEVPAPAGKCHDYTWKREDKHGELLEGLLDDWWCPNAGVLRLDPKPSLSERRLELAALVQGIGESDSLPSNLPEQKYLARKLEGWHQISEKFNLEVSEQMDEGAFAGAVVFHFSGKSHGTQPIYFLNSSTTESVSSLREKAFGEWHAAWDALRADASAKWDSASQIALHGALESVCRIHDWEISESSRRSCLQTETRRWPCDTGSQPYYTHEEIVSHFERYFESSELSKEFADMAWEMSIEKELDSQTTDQIWSLSYGAIVRLLSGACHKYPEVMHWCNVALWYAEANCLPNNQAQTWGDRETMLLERWISEFVEPKDCQDERLIGNSSFNFPQWVWHCWRVIPWSMSIGAYDLLKLAERTWRSSSPPPTKRRCRRRVA